MLDAAGYGKQIVGRCRPAGDLDAALPGDAAPLAALQVGLRDGLERLVRLDREGREKLGWQPKYSNQDALLRNFEWYMAHHDQFAKPAGLAPRALEAGRARLAEARSFTERAVGRTPDKPTSGRSARRPPASRPAPDGAGDAATAVDQKQLVFARAAFDRRVFHRRRVAHFGGRDRFCAISSAIYLLNDVRDVEPDRFHPKKRFRPIASGEISGGPATRSRRAVRRWAGHGVSRSGPSLRW